MFKKVINYVNEAMRFSWEGGRSFLAHYSSGAGLSFFIMFGKGLWLQNKKHPEQSDNPQQHRTKHEHTNKCWCNYSVAVTLCDQRPRDNDTLMQNTLSVASLIINPISFI